MIFSNLEYVALRMARRFLFTNQALESFGHLVPYWRVNQGRTDPEPIVTAYQRMARLAGQDIKGKRVAELGCGATNSTGYEWTARLGGQWTGIEPFALFDPGLSDRLLQQVKARHPGADASAVSRLRSLDALDSASVELVVSNSVLEHVSDPAALFAQCRRVLTPGGAMLHQVDYRDHFFKYPFHFLQFSQSVWDAWLSPGDLPRHRLDDHLAALAGAGFKATVLDRQTDPKAFAAVRPFVDRAFAAKDPDMLATTTAAILAQAPL